MVTLAEGGLEIAEGASFDGLPCAAHEAQVEIKIVEGKQPQSQHFSGFEEVAEVGAGEGCEVGMAIFGEGRGVLLVDGVLDVDGPVGGEGQSVAGRAGGVHAVKHVDATKWRAVEHYWKAESKCDDVYSV